MTRNEPVRWWELEEADHSLVEVRLRTQKARLSGNNGLNRKGIHLKSDMYKLESNVQVRDGQTDMEADVWRRWAMSFSSRGRDRAGPV